MSITVMVADDHRILREGIRALLEMEQDLEVVGEAGTGLETIEVVEQCKPDVLVVDVMMPGLTGLEVIWQLAESSPETRVVVLSMYNNEEFVLEAMRRGALGYVLKQSASTELIGAIRAAAAGQRFLSPPLSERAIEAYLSLAPSEPADAYYSLTKRERQVFQLSAEGMTSKQISESLSISHRTVETHRAHASSKLGLRTHSELVQYAIKLGVLASEPKLDPRP